MLIEFLKRCFTNNDFDFIEIENKINNLSNTRVRQNNYLLKGTYNYNQVMVLNDLIGYSTVFGYCRELGPVAFIGTSNSDCIQCDGYFYPVIQEYGNFIDNKKYYFKHYSLDDAKMISNYTVYGKGDPRVLQNAAEIDKIDLFYDYRFMIRDFNSREISYLSGDLEMQMKLAGTYDFYQARYLAYGSDKDFTDISEENNFIQFAIVGDNKPVGIIDLCLPCKDVMFKDVWVNGEKEPSSQPIRFLTDEEAKKIHNFELYYFIPPYFYNNRNVIIEKVDRMMSKNFDFSMEDGSDYRLQIPSKNKVKVKSLTMDNNII